jgi:hypothetical protein
MGVLAAARNRGYEPGPRGGNVPLRRRWFYFCPIWGLIPDLNRALAQS